MNLTRLALLPLALLTTLVACGKQTPEEAASRSIPNVLLFSDAEKANSGFLPDDDLIAAGKALNGGWYTYDDALDCPKSEQPRPGMIAPTMGVTYALTNYADVGVMPPPEGDNNKAALRFYGGGYIKWGAGIGVAFNNPGGTPLVYDLTVTKAIGIRFWGRAENKGTATQTTLKVKIQDKWSEGEVMPQQCCYLDKNVCGPNACGVDEMQGCFDAPFLEVALTPEWKKYEIPFTDLKRQGFGAWTDTMSHAMDPVALTEAYQLQMEVGTVAEFDVYVDNVGFMLAAEPAAAAK